MSAGIPSRKGVFFYEAVFYRDEAGRIYSNGNIGRDALTLYLTCVDHLDVFCRLKKIRGDEATSLVNISADALTFRSIGLKSWFALPLLFPWVLAVLTRSWLNADVVIMRLPSIVSILLWPISRLAERPVVVELVSNPAGLLKNAYPRLVGIAILDRLMTSVTRHWVARSLGCIYVTRRTLQALYPSGGGSTHASNVRIESLDTHTLGRRLSGSALADRPVLRVGLIGSLSNEYKGIDVAIAAISTLREAGLPVVLHVLGKGPLMDKYLALARRLGCPDGVHFVGTKRKGKEVLDWLTSMDVYIQPSRVEGLPRALVEAMSVSLPCVATAVGGMPELLDEEWLVATEDSGALAEKLHILLTHDELYRQQAQANFDKAREFVYDNIVSRKRDFLKNLIPRLSR